MKFEDRIEALKRSLKYKRDYKKYDEYREKYGVVDSYINDNITPVLIVSPKGKELCKQYKIPYPFHPDHPEKIPAVLPKPLRIKKSGEHIYGLRDDRFLDVSIDISRNLKDIKQSIEAQYHFWNKQIKIGEGNKSTKLYHWHIYDLAKKNNLLQVTKELFQIKDSPSYDTEAMKYYRRVERAFNKADRLMKDFED